MADYTKKAIALFGRAAIEYPASVTAQSAYIAVHTRDNEELRDAFCDLHRNERVVRQIYQVAEIAHRNVRAPGEVPDIDLDQTRAVLQNESKRVPKYLRLNDGQLGEIMAMYPEIRGDEMTDDKELIYEGFVETRYFMGRNLESE